MIRMSTVKAFKKEKRKRYYTLRASPMQIAKTTNAKLIFWQW